MIVLALEASTSSAKAVLWSAGKGLMGVLGKPYSPEICDTVTLDPEGVFKTVADCAKQLIEAVGIKEIDIIGLSSIWSHSFLMLDADRKPLGRISTWANTDCAGTAAKYKKDESLNKWFYQRTGCPIHSIYTLWKWMYVKEESHWVQGSYISTLPEYIFERLTNSAGISKTVASAGGMLNIHNLEWDEDILKFAGIEKSMLSPLKEPEFTSALSDHAAGLMNVKPGIPVVVSGGDGALNQIAAGGLKEGIMTISVGTSGAIRVSSEKPVMPEKPSTWCYYGAEDKRIVGAATSGAGNCVDWFVKKACSGVRTLKELDERLAGISSGDAPVFLPFLFGERCPGWDDLRQGNFFGLNGSHSQAQLYFSVLEGVLFNLYQCYRVLTEIIDVPEFISISGGIKNSKLWLQMAADIFDREIFTSNVEHASLMGAVWVALKAGGELKSLQEINGAKGESYVPNSSNIAIYQERFEKYLKYYDENR